MFFYWPCTIEIAWVDLGCPYPGSFKQEILANRGQKGRSRSTGAIQSCTAIESVEIECWKLPSVSFWLFLGDSLLCLLAVSQWLHSLYRVIKHVIIDEKKINYDHFPVSLLLKPGQVVMRVKGAPFMLASVSNGARRLLNVAVMKYQIISCCQIFSVRNSPLLLFILSCF